MENKEAKPAHTKQSDQLMPVFRQVMVVGITSVFALYMLEIMPKLASPGASVALFSCALAAAIGLAVLHLPPVYFRLSDWSQSIAYGGLFAGLVLGMVSASQVRSAYLRTPEGAAEVAERLIREKAEAEQAAVEAKAERERAKARNQAVTQQVGETSGSVPDFRTQEYQEKLDSCFSWSGKVPDLVNKVRGKIHNPDSFEYIGTEKIKESGGDAVMTFRSENEFGATRRYKAYGIMRENSGCEFFIFKIEEDT